MSLHLKKDRRAGAHRPCMEVVRLVSFNAFPESIIGYIAWYSGYRAVSDLAQEIKPPNPCNKPIFSIRNWYHLCVALFPKKYMGTTLQPWVILSVFFEKQNFFIELEALYPPITFKDGQIYVGKMKRKPACPGFVNRHEPRKRPLNYFPWTPKPWKMKVLGSHGFHYTGCLIGNPHNGL